jgi:hypothetical protein
VGASGWSYVTPYRADVAESLRALQEKVLRDGDYYWWDEPGEYTPRPGSLEVLWASDGRWDSGTHSILDMDRVVASADPPDWRDGAAYGAIRPLPEDSAVRIFGTSRPSRAQFEAAAKDYASPQHDELVAEVTMRWAGLYVLLYEGDRVTEIGFWGISGD